MGEEWEDSGWESVLNCWKAQPQGGMRSSLESWGLGVCHTLEGWLRLHLQWCSVKDWNQRKVLSWSWTCGSLAHYAFSLVYDQKHQRPYWLLTVDQRWNLLENCLDSHSVVIFTRWLLSLCLLKNRYDTNAKGCFLHPKEGFHMHGCIVLPSLRYLEVKSFLTMDCNWRWSFSFVPSTQFQIITQKLK